MTSKCTGLVLYVVLSLLCMSTNACLIDKNCETFSFDSSKNYSIVELTRLAQKGLSCNLKSEAKVIFSKGMDLIESKRIEKLKSEYENSKSDQAYNDFLILYSINNHQDNEEASKILYHYAKFDRVAARALGLHLYITIKNGEGEKYLRFSADKGDLLAISFVLESEKLLKKISDCDFIYYYLLYKERYIGDFSLKDKFETLVKSKKNDMSFSSCVFQKFIYQDLTPSF